MRRFGLILFAGLANLGNFIFDISGYKVRTGYPRAVFSYQGCDGITETSAATSIGLILEAVGDQTVNCAVGEVYKGHVTVEVEVETPEQELKEEEVEKKQAETAPAGELFSDSEIEKVEPKKKEKKKKENCLKVTFRKIGSKFNEAWGGLYDNVNEDFANDKA